MFYSRKHSKNVPKNLPNKPLNIFLNSQTSPSKHKNIPQALQKLFHPRHPLHGTTKKCCFMLFEIYVGACVLEARSISTQHKWKSISILCRHSLRPHHSQLREGSSRSMLPSRPSSTVTRLKSNMARGGGWLGWLQNPSWQQDVMKTSGALRMSLMPRIAVRSPVCTTMSQGFTRPSGAPWSFRALRCLGPPWALKKHSLEHLREMFVPPKASKKNFKKMRTTPKKPKKHAVDFKKMCSKKLVWQQFYRNMCSATCLGVILGCFFGVFVRWFGGCFWGALRDPQRPQTSKGPEPPWSSRGPHANLWAQWRMRLYYNKQGNWNAGPKDLASQSCRCLYSRCGWTTTKRSTPFFIRNASIRN